MIFGNLVFYIGKQCLSQEYSAQEALTLWIVTDRILIPVKRQWISGQVKMEKILFMQDTSKWSRLQHFLYQKSILTITRNQNINGCFMELLPLPQGPLPFSGSGVDNIFHLTYCWE